MAEKIVVTRQDLYEKVWSTPMSTLAKTFHLSDVGLAKICRRHNIPRPGLGYWARLAHGKEVKREGLPPLSSKESEMIEIEPSLEKKKAPAHADRFEDTRTVLARIQQMSAGFKLNADVKHPLVLKLQKLRKELKPDTDGRLRPHWGYPDVRVSADSWGRALRIIDTVFTISGSLGFGIVIKESRETFLCICGEDVQIGIREKVARSRKARKETSAPISQSLEVAYDYNPTGMLILSIKNVYHGDIRVNWADNSQGRVEDQLKDFFGVVVQAAAVRKEIMLESKERAKKELEAERVRLEAIKKEQLERERIGKLVADAENWRKAVLIRQFISARLKAQQEREPGSALPEDFQEWLEWATKIANAIDPL